MELGRKTGSSPEAQELGRVKPSLAAHMIRHPSKAELLGYAEATASGKAIPAHLAKHVSGCPVCRAELDAMRVCLEFVAKAPALEARPDLAANILVAAQHAKQRRVEAHPRWRRLTHAARGMAYAATLAGVAAVWFTTAASVEPPAPQPGKLADRAGIETRGDFSADTAVIQLLAPAVSARFERGAANPWQEEKRRAVLALKADLTEALDALARNPGSERAGAVANASLRQQASILKELYVNQSL